MTNHAFSGSEALTECSDASARSMGLSPAGDDRCDAQGADHAAVTVVVAATVRVQPPRSGPGVPSAATARGNRLGQWELSDDVVAVAAGAGHRERGFAPGRARSTGLGPVSGRPAGPSRGRSRWRPGRSAFGPRRAGGPAGWPGGAAGRRPRSSPAADAGRSCPSRSPVPAAAAPTGCRWTARTGCPAELCGRPAACGLGDRDGARSSAGAARSAPQVIVHLPGLGAGHHAPPGQSRSAQIGPE